ncbi:MAG: PASTA domain-containing protein [Spirochaetota bacterium]|nr:PASTA domain-containing protein [Spirochaetota bacterium]
MMKINKENLEIILTKIKTNFIIYFKNTKQFIIQWSNPQTWSEYFIPENPAEHPRLVRFLFLTLGSVLVVIFIIFIISFTIVRISIPTVRVPSVAKIDITEAITILQSNRLKTRFDITYDDTHPKYQVIKQYPASGSSVREGREVNLTISLGGDLYVVPELCQLNKETAVNLLNQERIPYSIQVIPVGDKELNKVVAMSLPIGSTVPRDTVLVITITDAILKNQYKMDNFIRQPLEFAANTLFNNHITPIIVTVNVDSLADDGIILEQSTVEGEILMKNTSVVLKVGLYAYNQGDKEKLNWYVFHFNIPKVEGYQQQIIITNEDGTLEDSSDGEKQTAKFYKAVLEDELGRTRTLYERMGAEGSSFIRVFKAYGKAKIYVYANDDIIGSKEYGQ